MGLDFDMGTQGKKLTVTTKSYRAGIDLDCLLRDRMSLRGRYILERFDDPSSISGGDKIQHLFALEIRTRF